MGFLILFVATLLDPMDWLREAVPTSPGLWFGAALCFYALQGMPDKGFERSWGRWPQLIFGCLALVAIVYSLIFSGHWWGRPLGALLLALILYVTGHLGLSFVLAGILGQPG
jgi:hypothetical protein